MEREPKQPSSLWQSFGYALAGLAYVLKTQRNARIHVGIAVAVIALAAFSDLAVTDWALLLLTIGAVLAAEIGNTVVESIVDRISPEPHPLAKAAKDAAAGAVLCLAAVAVAVGCLILGPPLWNRLF